VAIGQVWQRACLLWQLVSNPEIFQKDKMGEISKEVAKFL